MPPPRTGDSGTEEAEVGCVVDDALRGRVGADPFLERVLATADVGTLVLDGDGTVVLANEAVTDVLGRAPDDLVGEPLSTSVADRDRPRLDAAGVGSDGGAADRFDVRVVTAAGEEVRVSLGRGGFRVDGERFRTVTVEPAADGDAAGGRIDWAEAIAHMSGYGFYQLDAEGRFVMVNDEIVEISGYPREDLLGEHASTLVGEEGVATCREAIRGIIGGDQEGVATVEFDAHSADGDVIPCEARISLLRSEDGVRGTFGVVRDISDRRERVEELREKRGLIEHVLETSPVGVGVITPDGDISRVNDRAEQLLGLTMEELSSQTFDVSQRKLYDSGGRPVSPEGLLRRVFDDREQVMNTEFTLERPDGDRIWASISIAPMTDESGVVEKAVIIATDITSRKEREETLREERDVIEHILGTSPVGVGVITPDGDISRVNDQAEELLGLTIEEITNQTLDVSQRRFYGASGQRVPPEDLLARVFDDRERVINSEFELERPDGERVWTALSMAPIESRDGDVEKAVVIATDISDRKEREKRLRESEARLRQIAENINSAIWMADADLSEILYINPAYEEITGRSRDSVYDNLLNHLDAVHPQDVGRVEQAMKEVAPTGRDDPGALRFQEKYRIVRPDGSTRWVNSFAFPLQDDAGEVYRFVGVVDDITEVKEQQLELGRHRDELETLNQINTVIRRVNQGLVQAATREEIETQVCHTLTDSKLFHAAWIGGIDGGADAVTPRTADGMSADFLDSSFAVDAVDAIGTTLESGDVQLIRDFGPLPSDLTVESPDDDRTLGGGHPSAAVIPLAYKDTIYNVLVAYSSRANAFSVREQAVLFELGTTIGLAINAVERKEALLTDPVVELEFAVDGGDAFLLRASEEFDAAFELEGITSQSDGSYLQYYGVTGVDGGRVREAAADDPAVDHARVVTDHDDGGLLEFVVSGPSPASTLAEYGGTVLGATFEDGAGSLVTTFPRSADVRNVVDVVRSTFPGSELVRKHERERSVGTAREFRALLGDALTERQRATLATAYHAGYFEWPRDSSGEEVARSLGVAPATFHQHIRAGVEKLVGTFVDDADG